MDKETADYVIGILAENSKTNNLAARISAMHKMLNNHPQKLKVFKDDHILSIRRIAQENKKDIEADIMIKINQFADILESNMIASKLKGE